MKYCGRQFSELEIESIRDLISTEPNLSRYKISVRVCEKLNWKRSNGRFKDMSCRVALLRMQADGLIDLPAARRARPISKLEYSEVESVITQPLSPPDVDLSRISVDVVSNREDSRIWNAYINRYHYLGHRLIPGAQIRYIVRADGDHVALLSFGASAWKIRPRDEFIGWTTEQRQQNLHLIINNSRFLILPWIRCKNLASRCLSLVSRRLTNDWQTLYAYKPVLIETFVESGRFLGTSYKASNWTCLGKTQGRGKLDRKHLNAAPIKTVWIYPLASNFREHLCV